jgi:uncharacterized protein YbjT (DUF2867 family)
VVYPFSAEVVKHTGKLLAPAGDAMIAMIHPRGIGIVAAVALTEVGHEGETYVITGLESITYDQITGYLSEATGRTIELVDIPDEAAGTTCSSLRKLTAPRGSAPEDHHAHTNG